MMEFWEGSVWSKRNQQASIFVTSLISKVRLSSIFFRFLSFPVNEVLLYSCRIPFYTGRRVVLTSPLSNRGKSDSRAICWICSSALRASAPSSDWYSDLTIIVHWEQKKNKGEEMTRPLAAH